MLKKDTRYYFFSGKGGVGKTSIATATALQFAKNKNKTLIISTDPAHSLSDSFEVKIGGEIKKLTKNLFAVEIDPEKAAEEYKKKLTPEIEKIESLKDMGLDSVFDTVGNAPGIDEIAAFDKFLQYLNSKDYDVIVFDTAPTGHALRFLSLPDVLDSWIGRVIKIRMKLSGVINIFKKLLPFTEESPSIGTEHLEEIKKRIEEARKTLSNPDKTHYNIVMIPEEMSIAESERAVNTLKSYGIPVKTIIINQIIPENPRCDFCTEKRRLQLKRIESIRKKFRNFKIIEIPLFKEEIKGFSALEKLGRYLISKP
ncbi:MAG: arsenic-transporting ATPase [Candidatus Aenigmatarchaeota archaeon]|nr:MAG: arsenic-transporting ATPase [Candidatus Aenigmarchaeota archaeon]RLJ07453.1 MAG: arsenic-transporting ATPase [Candidatus Aenigmarchaeota archaeon]RLJ08169.1 MAG: arsenic-transporting ATPase [Candidatus Aenigmarchaeota archaeon]